MMRRLIKNLKLIIRTLMTYWNCQAFGQFLRKLRLENNKKVYKKKDQALKIPFFNSDKIYNGTTSKVSYF